MLNQNIFHQLGVDQKAIFWIGILSGLLGASYWFKYALEDTTVKASSNLVEPVIIAQNVSLSHYGKDLSLKYYCKTKDAINLSKNAGTNFKNVKLKVYNKGHLVWHGASSKAYASDDMERFFFDDGLTVYQNDTEEGFKLVTESLTYDNHTGIITGAKPVTMTHEDKNLTGNSISFDTRKQKILLLNGVKGTYE